MRDVRHTETREGFTIRLEYFAEDCDWRDQFDDTIEDFDAIQRQLDNGELEWFCAHVVASKNGLDLGDDYLGGCMYASAESFMESGGYYDDMIATAIAAAKEAIRQLNA